jgi:hypothetical protein
MIEDVKIGEFDIKIARVTCIIKVIQYLNIHFNISMQEYSINTYKYSIYKFTCEYLEFNPYPNSYRGLKHL